MRGMTWNARTAHAAALGLLLAAGAAARLYGAWAARLITDYDSSIVGLMARHIAEGRTLPVFFYGQTYMGSFEPSVSAFLFLVFGESGFALNAGPALLAVGALLAAVLWARDAGGRPAALGAGLLLLMGPPVFYRFQFAPRGGYMAALLLGTVVLWLGARAAAALRAGGEVRPGRFFLIGLLAGLGWWSNQMITSALLVCVVLLLAAARLRLRRAGAIPGVVGFFVGSAPFWIWNARNGWVSLQMAGDVGRLHPLRGLLYLLTRYRQLVGAWPDFTWPSAVVFAFYPLGVLAGGWVLLRMLRRRPWPRGETEALAAAALHLGLSLLFFITSRQATMNSARFLVPMFPSAAVLAAAGLSRLAGRRGAALSVAVAIVIAAAQAPDLAVHHRRAAGIEDAMERDRALAGWLAAERIEAVYAHFAECSLNFRIGEAAPFTDLRMERYRPFARTAETARRVAVVGDHGALNAFLAHTLGEEQFTPVAGWVMRHAFRPPPGALADIPPEEWQAVVDHEGNDLASLVADRNADTHWVDSAGAKGEAAVTVVLARPRPLREARLRGPESAPFPCALQIEIRLPGEDEWRIVHPARPNSFFYWCGPRFFWAGRRALLAYRFPGDPMVSAVRFVRPPPRRADRAPWRLMELQLFAPGPDPDAAPAGEDLPALWASLDRRGIRRLYAGRWLSTRAHVDSGLDLAVELEHRVFPGEGGLDGRSVRIDGATAFAVAGEDLPLTRRMLEEAGYSPQEETFGPWTVLTFASDDGPSAEPGSPPALYWTGRHLLRRGSVSPADSAPLRDR